MQIQQGDTLYQKIETLPEGVKEVQRKKGAVIIAEGEHTGHAHRIFDVDAFLYELNGNRYLVNKQAVTTTHEEHGPVTIPPGTWKIDIVREKDWLTGMVSPVVD